MHTLPNQRESQSCFIVMWSGRGSLSNRICTCTERLNQGGQDTPGGWEPPRTPTHVLQGQPQPVAQDPPQVSDLGPH